MKFYQLVRVLCLPMLPALLSVAVPAATISVTNTNDSGAGSLRDVLSTASSGDVVTFAVALPATITLSGGELVISNDLSIIGPGASQLSLSGNTNNRIFNIATNRVVDLAALTIRDGRAPGGADGGGGILSAGTLTLTNCCLAYNSAGDNGGSGGAIANLGTLTVFGCTFQSNRSGYGIPGQSTGVFGGNISPGGFGGNGGAIYNGGTLTLHSCTFHENQAGTGGQGGGTSIGGYAASGGFGGSGGGIYNDGSVTVTACTISGNHAGPGGNGGVAFSVWSGGYGGQGGYGGNGGGIFNSASGSAMLRNTILGWNHPGAAGRGGFGIGASGPPGGPGVFPDLTGGFTSQGYNLVAVTNGSSGLVNASNGNILGTSNNPVQVRLGALQDNGGPTWTMSLLTSSPAINAGDDTLTGTDQRGFPRNSGAGVDIGALEGVGSLFSRGEVLLVGDGINNSIAALEVRSGAAVGTMVQPKAGAQYQIAGPRGLLCLSNRLLVVNQNVDLPFNGEILSFDLNTGVYISRLVGGSNPNAPYAPRGIIAGSNNMILVADVGGFDGVHPGRIARYGSAGQFLGNVSISGLPVAFYPMGLVIGPDGFLYVAGVGNLAQGSLDGFIFRFRFDPGTQNYHYQNTVVSSTAANFYSPGLHNPEGIVFGPDGNLYVISFYAGFTDSQGAFVSDRDAILVFNKTGQRIGSPIYLYAEGENRVFAQTMLFGPRGDLFVPLTSAGQIRRYTAASNYQQFHVLPAGSSGSAPREPWYLTFRATNPSTLAYEPPKLTGVVAGDAFDVSWPATYCGWQLQVQTNALGAGMSSNWSNIAGSAGTNQASFMRNPADGCVFYRLTAP